MEQVFNWIVQHWRIVVYCCLVVCQVVLFLVRKKPVKVIDTIGEEIIALCLGAICGVEKPGYTGVQKKAAVLDCVKDWLIKNHPEVDFQIYLDFASKMIEKILSTPQKKGEKR